MDHASCHRDCRSGSRPGRLQLVFLVFRRFLQVGAAARQRAARIRCPPGAEARTSLGPSCKTPCSVPVTADGSFSVTFTLPKFQPMTIPVQVTRVPGDFTTPASTSVDPNPVVAELQPARPPQHVVARRVEEAQAARAAAPAAGQPAAPAAAPAADRRSRRRAEPFSAALQHAAPIVRGCAHAYIAAARPASATSLRVEQAYKGTVNERTAVESSTDGLPRDDRPVRAGDQLSARVGDRSLRPALLLLHVGRHDVPAEGRPADAGGTRPAVFGLHRQGRAQAAPDRRRAAGAAQHDVAGALAVAPSRQRRARTN